MNLQRKLALSKKIMLLYGSDILASENMQLEKQFMQHGDVSVFVHSINVTLLCILLAKTFHLAVDEKKLVRGSLLHDYFLYDWHVPEKSHRLHGFSHPGKALQNASEDFALSEVERDMIKKHMFPLTPIPPKYRESALLCIADKLVASCETLKLPYLQLKDLDDL